MKGQCFTVSIIIPSAGRRLEFLRRAIKSVLIDDEFIKIEVLVILNGVDGLAFNTALLFSHPSVKYYKIVEGNVSKARNFGLSHAQGELIRFLDDDDYLISSIALRQYRDLYHSINDFSTYNAEILNQYDESYGNLINSKYINGYDALIGGELIGIPILHVYKKNILQGLTWNEKSNNGEDFEWLFNILLSKKCAWLYENSTVGVWFQHDGERLSKPFSVNKVLRFNMENIIEIYKLYFAIGVLENKKNLAMGVWHYAHKGFYFSPFYWTKLLMCARKLDQTSRPQNYFFKTFSFCNPILLEWLLIPIRWLSFCYRMLKNSLLKKNFYKHIDE